MLEIRPLCSSVKDRKGLIGDVDSRTIHSNLSRKAPGILRYESGHSNILNPFDPTPPLLRIPEFLMTCLATHSMDWSLY